jgi:hypothetical protein
MLAYNVSDIGDEFQANLDCGMLVRRVIVYNQMDVKICRNVRINVFEKLEIFLMAMMAFKVSKNLSDGYVKSSKQCGGTIPRLC